MGCAFTKNTDEEPSAKHEGQPSGKGSTKGMSEPPEPPPVDPRLPLTARQKFSITKSWKGISRAMEATGVNMFVKLFEQNEELLQVFVKFQHLKSAEAQREDEELALHATRVMETIDESISSLDNVDYFIEYLHSIGKMHRKLQGFRQEYFWRIEKPFLDAVRETLEDRYTENIESIYKITIRFILETLVSGYEAAGGDSEVSNAAALEAATSTALGGDTSVNQQQDS